MQNLILILCLTIFVSCNAIYTESVCNIDNLVDVPELNGEFLSRIETDLENTNEIKITRVSKGIYMLEPLGDEPDEDDEPTKLRACKLDKQIYLESGEKDETHLLVRLEILKNFMYFHYLGTDETILNKANIPYKIENIESEFKIYLIDNKNVSSEVLTSLLFTHMKVKLTKI